MEIALLFVGAILGVIFAELYNSGKLWLVGRAHRHELAQRREDTDPRVVSDYLVNHYKADPSSQFLFEAKIGGATAPIPFFSKPEWCNHDASLPTKQITLSIIAAPEKKFPVDVRLIDFRCSLGQRIWNSRAMYCAGIASAENKIEIKIGECDYSQVITTTISLEERVFQNARNDRRRKKSLQHLPTLASLQSGELAPTLVGCAVLFAFKRAGKYHVLVGTRSKETATFGGTVGLLPNYGLAPVLHSEEDGRIVDHADPVISFSNRYSITSCNFIKECVEELYNNTALDDPRRSKRLDQYWFYSLPESERLLSWIRDGSLTLHFLGFGFDLLNSGCVMAHLAVVNDQEVVKTLLSDIAINWEVTDGQKLEDYEVLPIDSPKLQQALRDSRFHPGAAFTLSLASRFLRSHGLASESL